MKQVASEIDVKPGTVAFHKYRMMETLNITQQRRTFGIRTQAPDDDSTIDLELLSRPIRLAFALLRPNNSPHYSPN